jgi:hypothetical protein
MKIKFLLLTVMMIVSSCAFAEPIVFPSADIVYQAIDYRSPNDPLDNKVGFVNVDGTGSSFIELKYRPSRPVYSSKINGFLFLLNQNPLEMGGDYGSIFFLNPQGAYDECRQSQSDASGFIFPINGTETILVNTRKHIKIINLDNCNVEKTVVTYENDNFHFIGSASVSDTGEKIIYDVRTRTMKFVGVIYIVDINTGVVGEILDEGQNPSLSPDEKTIAYLGKDGVYIAEVNGAQQKLLVPISISDYSYRPSLLPAPFWSPDGVLLVYHKCVNQSCEELSDFSIYKINVQSGEEEKIIDNGLFPVWIK